VVHEHGPDFVFRRNGHYEIWLISHTTSSPARAPRIFIWHLKFWKTPVQPRFCDLLILYELHGFRDTLWKWRNVKNSTESKWKECSFSNLSHCTCRIIFFSSVKSYLKVRRLRLKCDGTRAENRWRFSAKRTSPFKSAGGGRQFNRLVTAEVCASAVVMVDTPCSEVVWRVLATHSIRQFPFHLSSRASPCAIKFQQDSTTACIQQLAFIVTFRWLSSWLDWSSNPTRTTDSNLNRITSTSCFIHIVVPHDDGPRYARHMQRLTKYIKNKLWIKLVFFTQLHRDTWSTKHEMYPLGYFLKPKGFFPQQHRQKAF